MSKRIVTGVKQVVRQAAPKPVTEAMQETPQEAARETVHETVMEKASDLKARIEAQKHLLNASENAKDNTGEGKRKRKGESKPESKTEAKTKAKNTGTAQNGTAVKTPEMLIAEAERIKEMSANIQESVQRLESKASVFKNKISQLQNVVSGKTSAEKVLGNPALREVLRKVKAD